MKWSKQVENNQKKCLEAIEYTIVAYDELSSKYKANHPAKF